ncbi:hypothetical protein OG455_41630 [Kitasatospora sp. NBC_01287]|uniref:hypothetical protein n=1 Tax=Kitasatospora sp. NBC_01287 TaxID=2903573 RepID=UPI0022526945|nr:hypothetical protein [Kitasatospora sp. NBC_01287]MCX4750986.1 hypothetical protein [Kitasatospora sp. NBC_01287]MCX4751763.1 hypothetical protein [Kitasatospora sp. NBC_01287]MCX4751945.1 hypothetical protein [Kitasatospora sp. NBC_01287]
MTARKFGFTVEYVDEPWDEDNKPGWRVFLPHQCDQWRIDDENAYEDPTVQTTALARLDAFIAEAQQARAALARGEQYPTEEQ